MIVVFSNDTHGGLNDRMLACMKAQQLLKQHGIKFEVKTVHQKIGITNSQYEIHFKNPEDYSAYMIIR